LCFLFFFLPIFLFHTFYSCQAVSFLGSATVLHHIVPCTQKFIVFFHINPEPWMLCLYSSKGRKSYIGRRIVADSHVQRVLKVFFL
jgi:hypothetical protein